MERKIYNPIQKDQVIFLKTYSDTNGECTLVEVELADGGESATADPNVNHLFRNRSGKPCKFRVELRPASRGFE